MRLLDHRGRERHLFVPGETLTLALAVRAEKAVQDFVFGLGLFTADGVSVYGTNTHLEDHVARKIEGEGEVRIVLEDLRLVEGTYLVDVAAHRKDGTPYDYHRGQVSFRVKSRLKDVGSVSPAPPVRVRGRRPGQRPGTARRAGLRIRGEGVDGGARSPPPSDLVAARARWRASGSKVVFTNGCFDLLHAGHVHLLEAARAQGDLLVVGLNSDASVTRLKGPSRPVVPEAERAEAVLALEAVDHVLVYGEDTPREVIAALLPDVLVKGADWEKDAIVGRAEVEAAGGRVVRVDLVAGRSTSSLLDQIRHR